MLNSRSRKFIVFFGCLTLLFTHCSNSVPNNIATTNTANISAAITSTPTKSTSTSLPPTPTATKPPNLNQVYPQLPGSGALLNLDNLQNASQEYREIAFLIETITKYDLAHPTKAGSIPTEQDKTDFQTHIKDSVKNSEFSDLLDRKYQKSESETLTFDYYLEEFIGRYYNYNNESTGKNELIQCLGWQTFIGDMIFAHYNFPVAALGHYPLTFPSDILYVKNHGDINIQKTSNLNIIQKGDTFNYGKHTGLVLNKYFYEGEYYYLITESNSPKGATDYYKPTGQPVLYLADTVKLMNAIKIDGLTITRPNNRYDVVIEAEEPTGTILQIIANLKQP